MRKLIQKESTVIKDPIWSNVKYQIIIKKDMLQNTQGAEALIRAMLPSIRLIGFKWSPILDISSDDVVQALCVITLDLLRTWDVKKSKWSTYFIRYAVKKMLSEVNPSSHGYKSKEYLVDFSTGDNDEDIK